MNNVKETLQKLEDLLSDRSKWTTEELARDADGDVVEPEDPTATCFCLLGAAYRVSHESDGDYCNIAGAIRAALNKHAAEFNGETLVTFVNDCQGYDAVMKLIQLAKEEA